MPRIATILLLILIGAVAAPSRADYDPELERQEAARIEAERQEEARRKAEADALRQKTELHAMRQFLGAEAEGKSDAEVRRLYTERTEAYKRQGEAAAAAAPTAAEAERMERDARTQGDDAAKAMTGKSLEELESMSEEELEALERELEKKYGTQ